MKRLHHIVKVLILLLVLISLLVSCTGYSTGTSSNPVSERMAAEAGIPNDSENVIGGGVVPNLKPMVEASILAAANLEAVNIKTAVRLYLTDQPNATTIYSDALWPIYTSNKPKATYLIEAVSVQITKVSSLPEGWHDIVFSLSQQKWLEGSPDNNHINDQDIP